jgi:hypothetical protein
VGTKIEKMILIAYLFGMYATLLVVDFVWTLVVDNIKSRKARKRFNQYKNLP